MGLFSKKNKNKYKSEEEAILDTEAITLCATCGYIPSIEKCKTALLLNNMNRTKARDWLIKN